jgi:hypothetical protein
MAFTLWGIVLVFDLLFIFILFFVDFVINMDGCEFMVTENAWKLEETERY